MSNTNKYKSLVTNTLLFAVGTFGSKLIQFFLFPFITYLITPEESGTADLITSTCNLIVPIMFVAMNEAVIRFGMDRNVNKSDVYTTSVLVTALGFSVTLLLRPLLIRIDLFSEYSWLIYLYIIASALRSISNHFVRALGHVRLFAVDGMITILTTSGLTILFLAVFKMGITGYILATVIADLFSALSLTILAKTYQYFDLFHLDRKVFGQMLRYSAPLVTTSIFWWVTNLSDKYLIVHFLDESYNGLYNAANKIPMIILMISAVFIQAWQMSAFSEYRSEEGEAFYSVIFRSYYTVIFLTASALIMIIRPFMRMMSTDYYVGWSYAPFLILAVSFSCFVTFFGTIYNAAKNNAMVTITTAIGAVINLSLNWITIPIWGVIGAAFSTFISYFVVFLIRAIHSRRYMRLTIYPLRMVASLALLLAQIWVCLTEPPYGMYLQGGIFLALLFTNNAQLLTLVEMLVGGIKSFLANRRRSTP